MIKIVKYFGILMIFAASLMVGIVNNQSKSNENVNLKSMITVASADGEIPNDPWLQVCIPCPGGVEFYCAMAGWEGCFTWPCGGGYC